MEIKNYILCHHLNVKYNGDECMREKLSIWDNFYKNLQDVSKHKVNDPVVEIAAYSKTKSFAVFVTGRDLFLAVYNINNNSLVNVADVKRDLGYIELYLEQDDVELTEKQLQRIRVINELYEQQEYMYKNNTHSVKDRICSISQPYIRPIVRGKAKTPTKFGAKLDMSIDENGIARLEKLSFDAYNECDVLIGTIMNYHQRTGHYPERVLVDQIYRNRKNLAYCKEHGIRVSGPALGRPRQLNKEEKEQAYSDNIDRIEVERGFSLAKRCYGLGLIRTKLDTTTRSSIALSIIAMNVDRLTEVHVVLFLISIFSRYNRRKKLPKLSTVKSFA